MAEKSQEITRLRGWGKSHNKPQQEVASAKQGNQFLYNLPTAKFMKGYQLIYREKEYFYWFQGNINLLMQFYSLYHKEPFEMNVLKRQTWYEFALDNDDDNLQMVHAPVAGFITTMFRDLVFSGPIDIKINGKVALNKRLQAAFGEKENDIQNFLRRADMMESVGGTILIKANYDENISDYPILEYYEAPKIDYEERFGRITNLFTVDTIKRKDVEYSLVGDHSRLGIDYKLFRNGNEVPMNEVYSASNMPVGLDYGKDANGKPKLGPVLAVWKQRHLMSKEFYDMKLGASDYEGHIDGFMNCDEIYSRFMNQIRATAPLLFMSEELMGYRKDAHGNLYINKPKLGCKVYELAGGIVNVDGKSIAAMFNRDVPELTGVGELASAFEWQLRQILSLMFIAPSTGNMDTESIGSNTTGSSLFKREQSTHLVRKQMIESWTTAIKSIVVLMCEWFDIIDKKPIGDYSELSIDVNFPDIDMDDFQTRLDQAIKAFTVQLFDIPSAVRHAFKGKMSETDMDELIKNLEKQKEEELQRQEEKMKASADDKDDMTKKADIISKMVKDDKKENK